MSSIEFLKEKEVSRLRARSRSSTYADIAAGLLTKPVHLGGDSGRSVAWPRHEIDLLSKAQLAGKKPAEIRQIVDALHIARLDAT
jgi:predicted DNA-binding transcriptional regulator AlpA